MTHSTLLWTGAEELVKASLQSPHQVLLMESIHTLQGFATGDLDSDAYAPRLFVEKGLEIIVAQSYSKNLGLVRSPAGSRTCCSKI